MSAIQGKVALVTGGASGIGLEYVRDLLRNGLKGALIVDLNPEFGKRALEAIAQEFGEGKVYFQQADVTNKQQFEDAFKKVVEKFKQLDIVINNAGILNDKIWEKQIDLNINALTYGTLLAIEQYLPKYRSGSESVVVNIASIVAIDPFISVPIYSGTKSFVIGFSRGIGAEPHYKRTKTRVLTICPGITDTPLISEMSGRNLGPAYEELIDYDVSKCVPQPPTYMGKGLIKVLNEGTSGSVWVIEGKQPAVEVNFPHRSQRLKK